MPELLAMPHLWLDEEGRAWINDARIRVAEIASAHLAHGWSAEAIHEQLAHLSLAQIYAALAFSYDQPERFEREIAQEQRRLTQWKEQLGESPLQRRLRQVKRTKSAA